jgi:hypothetical protein
VDVQSLTAVSVRSDASKEPCGIKLRRYVQLEKGWSMKGGKVVHRDATSAMVTPLILTKGILQFTSSHLYFIPTAVRVKPLTRVRVKALYTAHAIHSCLSWRRLMIRSRWRLAQPRSRPSPRPCRPSFPHRLRLRHLVRRGFAGPTSSSRSERRGAVDD